MSFLGNLLWIFFGGALLSLMWAFAGLICCITVIGIPVGLQCFKIAGLVLFPFGHEVVNEGGTGNFILNLLWILVFGWELALSSFVIGLLLCVTIVGIPFGLQYFKYARLALCPFGARIVSA